MSISEKEYDAAYQEWHDSREMEGVNTDELQARIIEELTFVRSMPVEEYTLFTNWADIKERFPTEETSTLFGSEVVMKNQSKKRDIDRVKTMIWSPTKADDYLDLEPELVYPDTPDLNADWNNLYLFVSTKKTTLGIGREIRYLIRDAKTRTYLGVIALGSDFIDLTCRDEYIGWTREDKQDNSRLNHTCIGSTIVPTQPFGFNYTGGKLLSLLCLSDPVQNRWKEQYGDVLAGVTTTSLYSTFSQYNGLKYWRKCGKTKGTISYEPRENTVQDMKRWLHDNSPRFYFDYHVAPKTLGLPMKRDPRNRTLAHAYRKLDIPKDLTQTDHCRGVYFSSLYENTREFLRREIEEDKLVKKFDSSVEAISDLWKEKYAKKRIERLTADGRENWSGLFSDQFIYLDWDEVKSKCLADVGR